MSDYERDKKWENNRLNLDYLAKLFSESKSRWCNGLAHLQSCSNGSAICKNLGLSPTYDQWNFRL